MEGGEINLFGSHMVIKTTEFDLYSPIKDFLTEKLVEEKADTMYNIGVAVTTTLAVIAGVAIFCAVTVATGGTALVLGGIGFASSVAAVKVGDYTCNTLASDKETGYDRSWQEFYQDLNKNVMEGAVAGALVYVGILLFIDIAAMSASLLESFFNASPALAGIEAIGQEAAVTAIPNLDALVNAASIAAIYEIAQSGKGGELQGGKDGVHFEKSDNSQLPKNTTDAGKEGSKSWNSAKKKIKEGRGKGINTKTSSQKDAEKLLNQARPELENKPTYSNNGKSGYEFHPAEPGVGNNKPHIKWWDWSNGKANGAEGHIFYD